MLCQETGPRKGLFPRRQPRAPGPSGLARGVSEMACVLTLNTNLSHYLIFSHGPVCFLLNKLQGHRKQGPDLNTNSSCILVFCLTSLPRQCGGCKLVPAWGSKAINHVFFCPEYSFEHFWTNCPHLKMGRFHIRIPISGMLRSLAVLSERSCTAPLAGAECHRPLYRCVISCLPLSFLVTCLALKAFAFTTLMECTQ